MLPQECFKQPLAPRHAQFEPMLGASPALAEALQKVTTIGQITLLVPRQQEQPGQAQQAASEQQQGQQQQQPHQAADGGADPGAAAAAAAAAEAPLCVINTHLFFHPFAPHIRSLHVAALQEEAAACLEEWAAGEPALRSLPPPVRGGGGGGAGPRRAMSGSAQGQGEQD